jgi:hypothetical protein
LSTELEQMRVHLHHDPQSYVDQPLNLRESKERKSRIEGSIVWGTQKMREGARGRESQHRFGLDREGKGGGRCSAEGEESCWGRKRKEVAPRPAAQMGDERKVSARLSTQATVVSFPLLKKR